ncbi:MAG: hypothetical protein Q8S13_04865 [Dehalococcoidia bacterium]|nr:hypothetical protein [Dehalococcoidia bacterium]
MTTQLGSKLYHADTFKRLLAQDVADASETGRPYSVLAVVPQHLPGEGVADIVDVAAGCILKLMRPGDLGGRLDDEILVLGLDDTDGTEAKVCAHRLQGELRLRSAYLRNSVWETGVSVLYRDGETVHELLAAAIDAARNRRRLLAT